MDLNQFNLGIVLGSFSGPFIQYLNVKQMMKNLKLDVYVIDDGLGMGKTTQTPYLIPEFQVFSDTEYGFRQLLKLETFVQFGDTYVEWVKSILSDRLSLLKYVGFFYLALVFIYMVFLGILEVEPKVPLMSLELGVFLFHAAALVLIYKGILLPFLNAKKFNLNQSKLQPREASSYMNKQFYQGMFVLGVFAYLFFALYWKSIPFMWGSCVVFLHLLLVRYFSIQIIEKGSPFDPSTIEGEYANHGVLFVQHFYMNMVSLYTIILHSLSFSVLHDVEPYHLNLVVNVYVFLLLIIAMVENRLKRKQMAKKFYQKFRYGK